jgi:hypothetical protein
MLNCDISPRAHNRIFEMSYRAAEVKSPGSKLEIVEKPIPHPGAGEVLVKVRRFFFWIQCAVSGGHRLKHVVFVMGVCARCC